MMDKSRIGKGAAYLYVEAIVTLFSGYVYWLILSKITTPSIIGTSSSILSLILIFSVVSSIGVGSGIQRFLGKSISDKKMDYIKGFINSSLIIIGIGIIASSIILLFTENWIYNSIKIDFALELTSVLIMITTSISGLLRAIIIPSLNTKILTFSSILSVIIKLVITIILVFIGTGVIGVLIGYMLYPLVSSVILTREVKKIFYKQSKSDRKNKFNIFSFNKDIFISSIGFWIPAVITTIGSQLGTIFVMVSSGSNYAGYYFISFSLVTGISMIMSVLLTIAYPTISSLVDGRKRAVWRLVKISIITTVPLSHAILFYSAEILQLFGRSYTNGYTILEILLLSILPTAISSGIGVLVYAYGNNRQVLVIGLFTSIPRTLLYFIFVPIFGGNGAALTYLIGSIAGLIVSLIIAKQIKLKMVWSQIASISLIPLFLTILIKFFNINFIFGITLSVLISYIIYLKFHIIDSEDVHDVLRILPKKIADPITLTIVKISNKMR